MSSNFYNEDGVMVGGDYHLFLVRAVLPITWVTGVPVKSVHLVSARNGFAQNDKHTTTVMSEGKWMCQRGFAIEKIVHVPLFPYPIWEGALLEIPLLAFIIAFSESKPKLWVHSVTGQGLPLACCIYAGVGFQLNCDGFGLLFQSNTVRTCPSVGDYAAAAFDIVVNIVLSVLDPAPSPLSWVIDKTLKSWVTDPMIEFIRDLIQETIDG